MESVLQLTGFLYGYVEYSRAWGENKNHLEAIPLSTREKKNREMTEREVALLGYILKEANGF